MIHRFVSNIVLGACLFALPATAQPTGQLSSPFLYVVEEGFALPEQRISHVGLATPMRIRFEIISGDALFADSGTTVYEATVHGNLSLPAIAPGPSMRESVIWIAAGDEILVEFRVTSATQKSFAALRSLALPVGSIPFDGDHYLLVDENQLGVSFMEGRLQTLATIPAPPAKNLCVRSPFGPGRVEWGIPNPRSNGYSVKPESSIPLTPATSAGQDIDAIYNQDWGCGTALKVPSHCTATATATGIDCCCNAAASLVGGSCRWVAPGSGAEAEWRPCPLIVVPTVSFVPTPQNDTSCDAFCASPCVDEVCTDSPIVLDLNGNGIHLTGLGQPVRFDIDADGFRETIGWTRPHELDALLALDFNGNGWIDSGRELFGNYTLLPDSTLAVHGYAALAFFDRPAEGGNGNGAVDRGDAIFSRLLAWFDSNHNGLSEPGELISLAATGVESIDLRYRDTWHKDHHGNVIAFAGYGWISGRNGRLRLFRVADVYFVRAD